MSEYLVTVRSQDLQHVVLNDGDTVFFNWRDPSTLGAQTIYVEGLVSDGRMMELSGEVSFLVGTQSAGLDFPMNLIPAADEMITMDLAQIDLDVVRNLSGTIDTSISLTGSVTVSRVFDGSQEQMTIADAPSTLSASVFTVVSDWSESPISALSEKTIDEMVYKEVGG